MFRKGMVVISFDYADRVLEKNRNLTCLVVHRGDDKIVNTSVVTRASIDAWYKQKQHDFPVTSHYYLVCTISIVGELVDIVTEDTEKNLRNSTFNAPKEPLSN